MTPEENLFNLQEIRARLASQHRINRLLAFDPTEAIWQQTMSEATLDELQQAYDQCGNKDGSGSVAIKKAIEARQATKE